MATKILIVALCTLTGTMGGLFFSNKLIKRDEYFKSLTEFINLLMSEVKFRKNTTKSILISFRETNKSQLNVHINEYLKCEDFSEIKFSKTVLNANELEEIKKFLLSIGTVDSETQIFELENYKARFKEFCEKATLARKVKSSMFVKLGFFAGLALGIVLL